MSNERTERAYKVASRAFRERLRETKPDVERELGRVATGEVVEVAGSYDRIGTVLRAVGIPFTKVTPGQVEGLDWKRAETLLVNCPGHLPPAALEILRDWVRDGGTLLTTDWALKHTLEPAFPGRVRHNGRQTPDCVVRVEKVADNPLLDGFLEDGRDPLWWLEGSSFPIQVLDRERVQVLVRSDEVARGWGEDPVVVRWEEGKGEVVHMLSHLYLQRTETRGARDRATAAAFFAESGYAREQASLLAALSGDLTASELKRALTSSALAAELIARRKQKKS